MSGMLTSSVSGQARCCSLVSWPDCVYGSLSSAHLSLPAALSCHRCRKYNQEDADRTFEVRFVVFGSLGQNMPSRFGSNLTSNVLSACLLVVFSAAMTGKGSGERQMGTT